MRVGVSHEPVGSRLEKAFMKTWIKQALASVTALGVGAAVFNLAAFAQAQSPMPPMPPQMAMPQPAPEEKPPQILGMDFTGYVDAGFTQFTTGRGQLALVTADGKNFAHSRTFDFDNGAVTLQNLSLNLNKAPETGFGGMIDLTIGKDADTIAAYGTIDKDRGPAGGVDQMFDVTQLFAFYGFGSGSLIVGKFVTHSGQEVIKRRDNSNFSSSILFGFAIPFTHTGIRATYKPVDTLTLILGANEGWDTIESKNGGTTTELGWEWVPTKAFSFFGSIYNGKEKIFNYPTTAFSASDTGTRNLIDLVFTFNVSDALSLVLNYDIGSQENAPLLSGKTGAATWGGWAGYANYTINDSWRTSLRVESFNDSDGYRSTVEPGKTEGPTWSERTITVAYMGIKNLELRGELRADSADQKIFVDDSSSPKPTGSKFKAINSQMSSGVEAIYKF
jgi:hypothetical protein